MGVADMVLKTKVSMGLDIDSNEIRIINADRNSICKRWVIESIPDSSSIRGRIISENLLGQYIKEIMNLHKISGKRCALCLPAHHVTTRMVTLPKMSKELIKGNIYYDIREYLPFDIENYMVDYRIINTLTVNEREYWNILIVAVLRETVLSYVTVLKKAGLKPMYLDVPVNCLQKLLVKYSDGDRQNFLREGNLCLIDLGLFYNEIIILQKGLYFVNKIIINNDDEIDLHQMKTEILGVIKYFISQISEDNKLDQIIIFGKEKVSTALQELLIQAWSNNVSLWTDWINYNYLFSDYMISEEVMSLGKAIGSTIRRIS